MIRRFAFLGSVIPKTILLWETIVTSANVDFSVKNSNLLKIWN